MSRKMKPSRMFIFDRQLGRVLLPKSSWAQLPSNISTVLLEGEDYSVLSRFLGTPLVNRLVTCMFLF